MLEILYFYKNILIFFNFLSLQV